MDLWDYYTINQYASHDNSEALCFDLHYIKYSYMILRKKLNQTPPLVSPLVIIYLVWESLVFRDLWVNEKVLILV